MKREDFLRLGFSELPHFTVTNSLEFYLSRDRRLSAGCIGTANEMIWLCQQDDKDPKKTTDLICLHNYDYDGLITEEKLKKLIDALS